MYLQLPKYIDTKYKNISDGLLNYNKVYINCIVSFFKRTIGNFQIYIYLCVCGLPQRLRTKKEKKKIRLQCRTAEDMGSIYGLGRSPGGGHGNPLQYSYLENPMDRGAWRAVVHRVTKR